LGSGGENSLVSGSDWWAAGVSQKAERKSERVVGCLMLISGVEKLLALLEAISKAG